MSTKLGTYQIPLVRFWLWDNGFYRKAQKSDYEFVVNTSRLSELLYRTVTLRGAAASKPYHHILSLGELGGSEREYPRVPVTSDDDTISYTGIKDYQTAVRGLLLLRDDALSDEGLLMPPAEVITSYMNYFPENVTSNRFVSLPSNVVLAAVRNAIQFHLVYADSLICSLGNVMHFLGERRSHLQEGMRTSISKVSSPEEFTDLLHPDIRRMGVERWSISKLENRFEALRKNSGLGELIRVYFGCVQIVVGALMARRQIELRALKTDGCLDETKRYLTLPL